MAASAFRTHDCARALPRAPATRPADGTELAALSRTSVPESPSGERDFEEMLDACLLARMALNTFRLRPAKRDLTTHEWREESRLEDAYSAARSAVLAEYRRVEQTSEATAATHLALLSRIADLEQRLAPSEQRSGPTWEEVEQAIEGALLEYYGGEAMSFDQTLRRLMPDAISPALRPLFDKERNDD